MSVYRIVVDEVGIIIEQGQVAPYLFNDEGGLAVSEGIFGIDENGNRAIESDSRRERFEEYWTGSEWAEIPPKGPEETNWSQWRGSEGWVENLELKELQIADAAEGIRNFRTNSLNDSDWTQLPDNALSDSKKAEWAAYRQELRDLPTQYVGATTYVDVILPEEPT